MDSMLVIMIGIAIVGVFGTLMIRWQGGTKTEVWFFLASMFFLFVAFACGGLLWRE